ncbi:MAG: hypothetical protein QXK48_01310 [Candidatus Aenigmatarchaeota archaeon]
MGLKKHIVSIFGYGSFFSYKPFKESDIDIYVVIVDFSFKILKKIRKFKKLLEKAMNRKVFLNILDIKDLPTNSLFYHRDREVIFSLDFSRSFLHLYGEDLRSYTNFYYTPQKIIDECLRNMHVLLYISKKSIINEDESNKREIAKNFVKAIRYINLLNGTYTYTVKDTIDKFLLLVKDSRSKYMNEIKKIITKYNYFNIFDEVKKMYYYGNWKEETLEDVINMFHEIVYRSLDYFRNFPFLQPIENCRRFAVENIKLRFYKSKQPNSIVFLPGIPNNPKEDYIFSFSFLGNVIIIENDNFINFLKEPSSIEDFIVTVKKIVKKYKANAVILSSFSTIFIDYIFEFNTIRKIVLFSPILKIDGKLKKILKKDISTLISLNKNSDLDKKNIDLFINLAKKKIKEAYQKIKYVDKKFLIIYSSNSDKILISEEIIKNLKKLKNVKVVCTNKNLHGYKLVSDFNVWSEILKFIED